LPAAVEKLPNTLPADIEVRGPIERCVNDPAFSGSTVRKGGVGG